MGLDHVQVDLHPGARMQVQMGDTPGSPTVVDENLLDFYRIQIPSPSGQPVVVTALKADDLSMNDAGHYNDSRVEEARQEGYFAHVITDQSGNRVTVLMTEEDWTRYQSALSDFAAVAARSPNLYHPNAASAGFGLFAPQAQAGGAGARPATPFRPIASDRMSAMGIGEGGLSSSYNDRDIDIAVFEARTPAARTALLNAGYVEVQFGTLDANDNPIRVPRFMTPLDAQLYRDMGNP